MAKLVEGILIVLAMFTITTTLEGSSSKLVNKAPACVKDTITKPLVDIFERGVLLVKNFAIPFQPLRADRQAHGLRKIFVKDGGKICFVRL
ncbi:MAG TPA: hypothetical protein VGK36_24575 [Candidatus Angelobacter sp.]